MIHDRVPSGTDPAADVAIVGGGPAGISLALSLARRGIRVCLLESGDVRFDGPSQALARGELDAPLYPRLHEATVRALGGSTWSWGGVCTEPESLVFEPREWVPTAGWPIERSELDRYAAAALELCGIDPEGREETRELVEWAFIEAGVDRLRLEPIPLYFGRPVRFGETYRDDLALEPTLDVFLGSTVTGLEVEGGAVTAAIGSSRGEGFRVRAREFVVCGGGIETPRLLLVSGIGGPAVGRNFMEHPRFVERFRVRPGTTPLGDLLRSGRVGARRLMRLALSERIRREEGLLNWHADMQFGYAGQDDETWLAVRRLAIAVRAPWNESPYFQDAGGGRVRIRAEDLATALQRPDKSVLGIVGALTQRPGLRRWLEVSSSVEQTPDPENRIELMDERDALGMPRVRVRWSIGAREERTFRRGAEILGEELRRLEPDIEPADPDAGDPWPDQLVGTWHQLGTTRMDDDPSKGVVDRNLRVHGLANLSVSSGAVFPVSGSGPPTVTIVQLSLRLADRLAARLGAAASVGGATSVGAAALSGSWSATPDDAPAATPAADGRQWLRTPQS